MRRSNGKRLTAGALALLLICGLFCPFGAIRASAQESAPSAAASAGGESGTEPGYAAYAAAHAQTPAGRAQIDLPGRGFSADGDAAVTAEPSDADAVRWESERGTLRCRIDVPADGLYTLRLFYTPLPGRGGEIRLAVQIDGTYPFAEARELCFSRRWADGSRGRTDKLGNETIPGQVERQQPLWQDAEDRVGQHDGAYAFLLTAGEHEICLTAVSEPFILNKLTFLPAAASVPYAEPSAGGDYTGEPIVIEGEDAAFKTASSLLPQADTDSAVVRPNDPRRMVLNYIGGTGWSGIGEAITWRFSVPEDGYYALSATYRQNTVVDGVSYREVRIDGEVPFAEAKSWAFPYAAGWTTADLANGGEPYRLYLTRGEHELTLKVCMGAMAPFRAALAALVDEIGDLYVQMHMITGEFPDADRSYELFRQIPGFNDTLQDLADRLQALAEDMDADSGTRNGDLIASLRNMRRVLTIMLGNPYAAHQYKSDYYTNYNTLSSWLHEMTSMPLSIDALYLRSPQSTGAVRGATFWQSLVFSARRFLGSFSADYRQPAAEEGGTRLKLWLSSSFDQVQVVQALLGDRFEEQTGIAVDVQLVNTTLVQGLLSGDFPDVVFGAAHAEPVDLAIRGALLDLTRFADLEQVEERFRKDACLPFCYAGGCYAIPDTQTFRVQFYRRDIFDAMGLSVPQTWDELSEVAAELMRNDMQVGLPYSSLTGAAQMSSGIAAMSLFPTLLLQHGAALYNDDGTGCRLNDDAVIDVFTELTDLYAKKGIPLSADFYNRFRAGLMPLGIQPYAMCTVLDDLAPDIRGRWSIAPLPGVRRDDGTVDRTDAAAGTGAFIVARTRQPQAAWELLKWWTSEDVQVAYSQGMEARLGVTGRQSVANVKAMSRLSWTSEMLRVLEQQSESVGEYPELPGGYYMVRAIDQAFWSVINEGTRPKDVLLRWNKIVDREIGRKLREYADDVR